MVVYPPLNIGIRDQARYETDENENPVFIAGCGEARKSIVCDLHMTRRPASTSRSER